MAIDPLEFEDYADKTYGSHRAGKGGGGKKGPTKSMEVSAETEKNRLQKERQERAETKIKKYIENKWGNLTGNIKEIYVGRFVHWFEVSSQNKFPDIDEKDIKTETMLSGGPGGQHHQKNQTAIRMTHEPTGMSAKSEERLQTASRSEAREVLIERLTELLDIWNQTSPEFRQKLANPQPISEQSSI